MHSFRCSQCLDDGQRLVNVWDVEPKMLVRFSNLEVDFPVAFSSNPNQTPEQAHHYLQDYYKVAGS